jgi:hypothetical protein
MPRLSANSHGSSKSKNVGWGPKHRPSTFKVEPLSETAPIGTYLLDSLAEEIHTAGARYWGIQSLEECQRMLRCEMGSLAESAMKTANEYFLRHPETLRQTTKLFEDLPRIKKLLERHENIDKSHLYNSTKRVRPRAVRLKDQPSEIEKLVTSMWLTNKAISSFLNTHEVSGKPGNHDPLTRAFIDGSLSLWTTLFWGVTPRFDEDPSFRRLVVAAWRDLHLPDKEEDGVLLEGWLSDRIRKQFPLGIYRARLSREEQWLAKRRAKSKDS